MCDTCDILLRDKKYYKEIEYIRRMLKLEGLYYADKYYDTLGLFRQINNLE